MKKIWSIILLIAAVVVIAFAMKKEPVAEPIADNTAKTETANETTGRELSETMASAERTVPSGEENAVAFTVNGGNFYFKPNIIKVKQGDTVTITFKNDEGFHDFVVDEFSGAKTKQIKAGGEEKITFVADKKGSFEYYCSVGTHRQMGMKGTLIIE